MRIAYLASQRTLPGAPVRRADAFEHDQMMACLDAAGPGRGITFEAVSWDDPDARWHDFDAAMIGTTWDYPQRTDAFLATLRCIETATTLVNSAATAAWNYRKTYLRDLAARGAPVIPTVWADHLTADGAGAAAKRLGTGQLVVKRQVGSNSEGQMRLGPGDAVPTVTAPVMIQPYRAAIATEGELSFIFIAGRFSHALQKHPAAGDYRVQSDYGGREAVYQPTDADCGLAEQIVRLVDPLPFYARVDMLRAPHGGLELMELELIEPFLFPLQGPALGDRIAQAFAALPAAAS